MCAHTVRLSVHAVLFILLSQFLGQMRLKEEVYQCLGLALGLVPSVTFCNMFIQIMQLVIAQGEAA
jgi:hypothetical protein